MNTDNKPYQVTELAENYKSDLQKALDVIRDCEELIDNLLEQLNRTTARLIELSELENTSVQQLQELARVSYNELVTENTIKSARILLFDTEDKERQEDFKR